MKIASIFLILFINCQALAQVPDNFNLIPSLDVLYEYSPRILTCSDTGEYCWMKANANCFDTYYGLPLNKIDTINGYSGLLTLGSLCGLKLQYFPVSYDMVSNKYLDTSITQRSYGQCRLLQKLEAGKRYYLSAFIGVYTDTIYNRSSTISLGEVEFYFSTNKISQPNNNGRIDVVPQFSVSGVSSKGLGISSYKKVKYSFIADGTEQYLTIGNFKYFKDMDTLVTASPFCNIPKISFKYCGVYSYVDLLELTSDSSLPAIQLLPLFLGNDTIICDNANLKLTAPNYYNSYLWSTGETTPFIESNHNGWIWVKASLNCFTFIDSIYVNRCFKYDEITIPTAFTPNNDGINDNFYINSKEATLQKLAIYNRFGNIVYSTTSYFNWDGYYVGRLCDEGVYFYLLQYIDSNNQVKYKKGDVTLLK